MLGAEVGTRDRDNCGNAGSYQGCQHALPWLHSISLGERVAVEVRLVLCEYTAAEAGLECTHSSGHQTRGSRLVFCCGAAAEDWHGCQCCSQALVGARAGESREGFTQLCGESW